MKKILLGIILGASLTILSLIFYHLGSYYVFSHRITDRVMNAAKVSFVQALPKAQVDEVGIELIHEDVSVKYIHDKLFKVTIYYNLNQQYKKVNFIVGVYKKHIIGPPKVDLLNMDDKAEILLPRNKK